MVTTYAQPVSIRATELKLADVIRLGHGPFMVGVVQQITENEIVVFRTYITTADFAYSGGVITYIGTEIVRLNRHSDHEYEVYERKELS